MQLRIVVFTLINLQVALAQQPSSSIRIANTVSTTRRIPTYLIYRHFLRWVADLDKNTNGTGADNSYKFAEPFGGRVGLQHSHLDIIRIEAKALAKDLAIQDAKAAAVIARFRAVSKDALQKGLPIPAAAAEIRELQQERDTLIKSHVSILRAALGPDAAKKLDAYLSLEFTPHVSLRAIAIPHAQRVPQPK